MEPYIQISKINDFIFCPKSVYLHTVYDNFSEKMYHSEKQAVGKIKHSNIEDGTYSTARKFLQGIEIYSEKYNIAGKIDIYDSENKFLIERKTKIQNIYDGYRYQIYAQYFCMKEAGFKVERLFLHSLSDNKRYEISLPNEKETAEFEEVLKKINNFSAEDLLKNNFGVNKNKCEKCVYNALC